MATKQETTAGISFGTALLLIFVVLKLTGLITWSWWWVISPLWVPLAIVVLVLMFAFVLTAMFGSNR